MRSLPGQSIRLFDHIIFHKWDADECGIGNVGAMIMVKSDKVEDAKTLVGEDFNLTLEN